MTRVWLSAMEWACCGEPFEIGDEVEFVIGTRVVPPAAVRQIGPALAATIDAVEERHPEIPLADRVRGRVTAVNTLVRESVQTSPSDVRGLERHRMPKCRPKVNGGPSAGMIWGTA